jgi:hypothetical protein
MQLTNYKHFSDWQPPSESETFLVNILKLCSLWEIHVGRKFAITFLEKLDLHPARRLELSRMFHIHEWVDAAVKHLLEIPLQKLTAESADQIGFKTYIMLCKTKEALEHERKLTAVNSINCFKVYHRLAVPDKYRRVSPVCSGCDFT